MTILNVTPEAQEFMRQKYQEHINERAKRESIEPQELFTRIRIEDALERQQETNKEQQDEIIGWLLAAVLVLGFIVLVLCDINSGGALPY